MRNLSYEKAKSMLRMLLIIGLIALVLPKDLPEMARNGDTVETTFRVALHVRDVAGDLYGIGKATAQDVLTLCEREPATCEKAARLGGELRDKAQVWSGAVHEWLASEEQASPTTTTTARAAAVQPRRRPAS
jgi:hypothetical protein